MVFLITAGVAFAQSGSIEGTITNQQSGEAVVGANVFIQSINKGAATDQNGNFTINDVPYDTYELRMSFIGYKTKTISITVDQPTVTVNEQLESSVAVLDELVVTAFGIERSKKSTPFQSKQVSSESINEVPSTSPAQGLVGKVAGLTINQGGGNIKPNNSINLRGLRSITRNNEPLVVIDGIKANLNAFRDLNSEDVENVNVLKGATSAALYGSDASNGALVVTTKSGTQGGELQVGIKNTTTFNEVAFVPDFQTKFGTGIDGAYVPYENTNWGPRFDGQVRILGEDFPDGYPVENQMVSYDYKEGAIKDFYQTGADVKNTLYFSGGVETGSFYLSLGQNNKTGLVPDDEYQKYTITANGTKQLGDVTLGVNANYFSDTKDVVGNNIGEQGRPLKWHIINTPGNAPLTQYKDYQDPQSYGNPNNYFNRYYDNPYWAIGTHRDLDDTNRLRGNVSAAWNVVDNINVTGRLGINSVNAQGKNFRERQTYEDFRVSNDFLSATVTDSESQYTAVNGNFVAEGKFELTDQIGLDAALGSSVEMIDSRNSSITANNLSVPGFFDISNGTGSPITNVNESQTRTYGFFGKATFDYEDWLFVTATGRQDFTSTLAADDNSYFYPSFGVSAVLTEAVPALEDVSFLTFLKVTANNSTVYSDLGAYETTEVFVQSGAFPLATNGFFLTNTAIDPDIKKEKLNSTEFSLNSAFFGGRLNFDASYYFTNTENLITNISPSVASASTGYLTNIGKLSGSGYEATLGGDVIRSQDFSWNVSANYSHYEQQVDEIQEGTNEIAIGGRQFAIKGQVFPTLKTLSYQRDDQGRVIVDRETGEPLTGTVDSQGQTTPKHIIGLNTGVNYKGLRLSGTMTYRTGHVYYATGIDAMEFTGRTVESAASNRNPFVFPNSSYEDPNNPGEYIANNSIALAGDRSFWTGQWNNIKENYVRDASALRLRTLAVNYSLPAQLLSRTNGVVSKVSLGFVGRNLLTFTPTDESRFSDPEFGGGGYFSAQPTRSYGFNVNIEF
jgi:TonB-linked SusC/RagA family outer membrane protein